MSESYYTMAAICENGHVISTAMYEGDGGDAPFCGICGGPVLMACTHCQASIRGAFMDPGMDFGLEELGGGYTDDVKPAYCHNCGSPYPWTEGILVAVAELADELDQLSDDEKALLKRSLDDIIADTAAAQVGALRFQRLVGKAGGGAAELFKELLKGAVSETMVKILFARAGIG